MTFLPGVTGYQGQNALTYLGAAIEVKGAGMEGWVAIYNNTGAALSNGAIKVLSYIVTSGALFPVPVAPATETTESNLVIVIDGSPINESTLADAAWGFAKFLGVVNCSVDGDTVDVAEGDQLEILNTGTAFTSAGVAEGAVLEAEACAIALEANAGAAATKAVFLLGKQAQIKAT